jgi:hypothetical protein
MKERLALSLSGYTSKLQRAEFRSLSDVTHVTQAPLSSVAALAHGSKHKVSSHGSMAQQEARSPRRECVATGESLVV